MFLLKDLRAKHYVFSIRGRQIGIVRVTHTGSLAELGRMPISRNHRSSGYGSKLINQLIANIKNNSKVKLIIHTLDDSLISFCRRFGFIENGEVIFGTIPYMNMIETFKR